MYHNHRSSLYSLHLPVQLLSAHFLLPVGALELVGSGEGSTQISPNHSAEVQEVLLPVREAVVGLIVEEGLAEVEDALVGSLQPNQPGVSQDVELLAELVGLDEVVVIVGAGAALGEVTVVVVVMVVGSLHPNQPGVLQEDVVIVLVQVVVEVVLVVSSRHPHQPGVLHVSVLVRVVVLLGTLLLVVVSLLLLSKNFQLKQSWHSTSSSHLGTASYFSITSFITLTIL